MIYFNELQITSNKMIFIWWVRLHAIWRASSAYRLNWNEWLPTQMNECCVSMLCSRSNRMPLNVLDIKSAYISIGISIRQICVPHTISSAIGKIGEKQSVEKKNRIIWICLWIEFIWMIDWWQWMDRNDGSVFSVFLEYFNRRFQFNHFEK